MFEKGCEKCSIVFSHPFLNVYMFWKFPTTMRLVPHRIVISPLLFAAVEMTIKWSKHLCQFVSYEPNDSPVRCLASVSPRQTGIYRLLCHYRQAPRFFAPLRMTGRAGGLRSAYLMSCFYSSRKAGIHRLLCHYRQAPRFFAPLRMTPRAGGLRPAGLMSSFCPPARPVFTDFCVTIVKHRDSSLTLRMTARAGGLRSVGLMSCFYSSRQTGIYRL